MSSYQSYSAVGHTNISSVASVSADLVAHRGIWRKVISIIIFLGFLITSWAVIVLHALNFTNESILELSVSISVLIGGQYINGIIYWRRWNASSQRRRTKMQEENKKAWIFMRITLTLLGMAPIASDSFIESIVAIKRMISLEKQYMSETIALVKEVQQPSNLPSGSLLSVPITNNQFSQRTKTLDISSNPSRMRQLDAGLQRVRRVRRQFCRTEHDAASIALTSGVVGAGPYAIAQGILFYRRETIRFLMTIDTKIIVLICAGFSMIWLSTSFTHFYPAQYQQSELAFERGVGQVHVIGLILLFFTHLIHITLRCFSIALFTGRFYPMILIILGGHFMIVLITTMVARIYTRRFNATEKEGEKARGDVCGNFFPDLIHSYVSLYEFINAGVKYTRTRYLIYYFFYYLENSIMIGLWYDYYEYPESWYYLPCLLVVILVQFLGFILLQTYLYVYSKSRRKTTLCGLCFAHKDTDMQQQQQQGQTVQPHQQQLYEYPKSPIGPTGGRSSVYHYGSNSVLRNGSQSTLMNTCRAPSGKLNYYPSMNSVSYAATLPKRAHNGGICDPVFGEQIAQSATPLQSKVNKRYKTNLQKAIEHDRRNQRPLSELSTSNNSKQTNKIIRQSTEVKRHNLSEGHQQNHKPESGSYHNAYTHTRQRPVSYHARSISNISQSTEKYTKRSLHSNRYLTRETSQPRAVNKPSDSNEASQRQPVIKNSVQSDKGVYQSRSNQYHYDTANNRTKQKRHVSRE
ncbi:unnamed protein product [Heterobilharzia americana]|nr:unnamed protein product [Heterobilharzia americana]